MNELNHGGGKGDKERSPGWRHNYDGIDFHRNAWLEDGFARRGNRLVKVYDAGRQVEFRFPEAPPANICECQERSSALCEATSAGPSGEGGFRWHCSRKEGHEGDHFACGSAEHRLAQWPQAWSVENLAKVVAAADSNPVVRSPGQQISDYIIEKGYKL